MTPVSAKNWLLCLILLLANYDSIAAAPPIYPYKCSIKIRGSKKVATGYLYPISDSTIFIAKTYKKLLAADSIPAVLEKFPVNDQLIQLRVRNRSAGFVGGLAGFGAGLLITVLVAKNSNLDVADAFVVGLVAAPLLLVGSAVVGAVAANSSSVAIYNHKQSPANALENVNSYSYINWITSKKKK